MIDSKELRIGNYVEIGLNRDFKPIISTVKKIEEAVIWVKEPNAPTLRLMPIETIKPIPLTEEWLLKFGFIELPDGLFLHSMYSIAYDLSDNTVKVSDSWEFGDSVKYVHQLQNLYFALTREELTLNPTKNAL